MEEWGTEAQDHISDLMTKRYFAPLPPLETWTKLKLPYKAHSCPPLPSWEQIRTATAEHRLHLSMRNTPVCKIGNTAIKYSSAGSIVEVRHFYHPPSC
jgi:hypothetical protein